MRHIFIINPYAGRNAFAANLRKELSQFDGFEYLILNIGHKGEEAELMEMIQSYFEDEMIRVYCCGGSGTLQNILSCINDFSKFEVAFYPCGMTNDFLKVFDVPPAAFHDLKALIEGSTQSIDYLKTSCGIALNTVSTGFDSIFLQYLERIRILSTIHYNIPYHLAMAYSMLNNSNLEYELVIDDYQLTVVSSEIILGNGHIFSGNLHLTDPADVCDGKFSYMSIPPVSFIKRIQTILGLRSDNYSQTLNTLTHGSAKRVVLRRTDGLPLSINLDGELIPDVTECCVEVIQKGLNFVVPKGVKLHEK